MFFFVKECKLYILSLYIFRTKANDYRINPSVLISFIHYARNFLNRHNATRSVWTVPTHAAYVLKPYFLDCWEKSA